MAVVYMRWSGVRKVSVCGSDPSSWGTALADFPNTNCDIGSHFRNQSIIANIDLCGDWAGNAAVYTADGCPGLIDGYEKDDPGSKKVMIDARRMEQDIEGRIFVLLLTASYS